VSGAIEVPAHAKVNLYLHVVGRCADGYHLLDSLIAFASVHDDLVAEESDRLSLALTGPFGRALAPAGADNLVLRAARRLAETLGRPANAALRLEKRLPIASGIGGGSADAAAALKALIRLWRVELPEAALGELALGLGADVPICLAGRAARVGGVGEMIAPLGAALPAAGLLLANPGVPVPTPAVFRARQGPFSTAAPPLPDAPTLAGLVDFLADTRNDLAPPALGLAPVIGEVLEALTPLPGCLLARLSGSGATCFGLFADERAAGQAAERLGTAHPAWWIAPGRLLSRAAPLPAD
jgi:4-diphosphocytidyl-2-C-methyl-D-erythritol kinase